MANVTNVKIVLNDAGVEALLKSAGMEAFIRGKCDEIAATASAGSGGAFEASTRVGRTRIRGSVITSDLRARKAESEDAILSRAGYSAGGNPGR